MEIADAQDLQQEQPQGGNGFPELTALGKRIEVLRIGRGLSKQHLARGAGTSRQQLWRVMTGKSELTSTLGQRLAEVLQVDLRTLRGAELTAGGSWSIGTSSESATLSVTLGPATLADFLADPAPLRFVLAALPRDEHGRQIGEALLDAVQRAATAAGILLAPAIVEVRAELAR